LDSSGQGWNSTHRRRFIGGSDALIIMGNDQVALLRMWREKCGEVQPEDLSANLIIQLGLVTEQLNRHWCERNTEARPTPDHANAHKRLFVVFDFRLYHQRRIKRRATETRVVSRQLAEHPRQVEDSCDGPHQMIFRNDLLEIEAIEKLPLVPIERSSRPIIVRSRRCQRHSAATGMLRAGATLDAIGAVLRHRRQPSRPITLRPPRKSRRSLRKSSQMF
jgi:hypothetical protein